VAKFSFDFVLKKRLDENFIEPFLFFDLFLENEKNRTVLEFSFLSALYRRFNFFTVAVLCFSTILDK
jgi:hypothetical protein